MRRARRSLQLSLLVGATLVLLPDALHAEVSDKIPSQLELWLTGVAIAGLGYLAWRWRVWAGLVLLVVSVPLALQGLTVLAQPDIGPHAIREQGVPYVVASGACALLAAVGMAFGIARRASRARHGRRAA